MTYQQSVRTVIKKCLVFKGRASRSEFWWFILFCFLLQMAITLFFVFYDFDAATPEKILTFTTICDFIIWLLTLAVGVRRMHDSGHGGGWVLIFLVPYIGWIWFIVLAAMPSEPGTNRFGPNPTNPVPPIPNVKNEAYQN